MPPEVVGLPVKAGEAEYVWSVVLPRAKGNLERDRLPGLFFAAIVVSVQVAWGAVLVYLGFRFL